MPGSITREDLMMPDSRMLIGNKIETRVKEIVELALIMQQDEDTFGNPYFRLDQDGEVAEHYGDDS